jgi:hypothetical protein
MAYFPLILHGPHRKRRLQQFFVAAGTTLPSCFPAAIGGYTDRPTDSPLIRNGLHSKWYVQQFFYCCVYSFAAGTSLQSCYPAATGGYTDRPTDSPLIRNGLHRKWYVQQFFYCCVYSFAAGTCLRSRCLAPKERMHFTEPLPSNNRRYTHIDTDW